MHADNEGPMSETKASSGSDLRAPTRSSWHRVVQRVARDLKAALIGPPEVRSAESWKHRDAYRQWLAENKKPAPLKDFLMYWFALVFILVSVLGGVLYAAHNALGWP